MESSVIEQDQLQEANRDHQQIPNNDPSTSETDAVVNKEPGCGAEQTSGTDKIKTPVSGTTVSIIDLDIGTIIADGTVRTRATVNKRTVGEYAKQMEAGVKFPPITVFADGVTYWLGDGFHRVDAAKKAGRDRIEAEVRNGTRLDAIKFGFLANDLHGLRRTNADKRWAVKIALTEFNDLSDRAIAELVGVGNQLVGNVRAQLCDSHSSTSRTGRDGKRRRSKAAKAKKKDETPADQRSATSTTPQGYVPEPGGVSADPEVQPPGDAGGSSAPSSPAHEQAARPGDSAEVVTAVHDAADHSPGTSPAQSGVETASEPSAHEAGNQTPPSTPEEQTEERTSAVSAATDRAENLDASTYVEFVRADGTTRQVPWFHNRLLPFKTIDKHVQAMKEHYESINSPEYTQPVLVKFQNALISAASLAVSVLGSNPTPTDRDIAFNALSDIRGMLPDPIPDARPDRGGRLIWR